MHKMTHGIQFQASYTYSKAIDHGSAILAGDPFGNSVLGLLYFAPNTPRDVADFNVPNIFTFNYLYELPRIKSLKGPLDSAINGCSWAASSSRRAACPSPPPSPVTHLS